MKNDKKGLLGKIGEFGVIDLIQKKVPVKKDVIKGIGDDCAVLPFNGDKYFLITTDMLVEGVHFDPLDKMESVGYKALGVNISDIAAMGGVSKFAVVSIGLTPETSCRTVQDLYRGINDLARKFGISIVGGDTVLSKIFTINITLTGEVEKKFLVVRSGAKPGDKIFVTGPLGNSLRSKKHLTFYPRQNEIRKLVHQYSLSSMIDISDGLLGDVGHILEQSHVGAVIDAHKIPLALGASLSQALYDGEDFELIFTVSAMSAQKLLTDQRNKCFYIGEIVEAKKGLHLRLKDGTLKNVKAKGYQHF